MALITTNFFEQNNTLIMGMQEFLRQKMAWHNNAWSRIKVNKKNLCGAGGNY